MNKRNTCPDKEELSLYLESDLTKSRQEEIKSHLAGCNTCRADVEKMQSISNMLQQGADVPALTPTFTASVMKKVNSQTIGRASSSVNLLTLVLGGIALAVLIVLPGAGGGTGIGNRIVRELVSLLTDPAATRGIALAMEGFAGHFGGAAAIGMLQLTALAGIAAALWNHKLPVTLQSTAK